jgi:hypothetical protein
MAEDIPLGLQTGYIVHPFCCAAGSSLLRVKCTRPPTHLPSVSILTFSTDIQSAPFAFSLATNRPVPTALDIMNSIVPVNHLQNQSEA